MADLRGSATGLKNQNGHATRQIGPVECTERLNNLHRGHQRVREGPSATLGAATPTGDAMQSFLALQEIRCGNPAKLVLRSALLAYVLMATW